MCLLWPHAWEEMQLNERDNLRRMIGDTFSIEALRHVQFHTGETLLGELFDL